MTTNTLKTALLLGLLSGLLLVGGGALGGRNGLYIGLGLAVVMNFASYFFSDKIALAMYSAQPVTRNREPRDLPPRGAHRAQPLPAHGPAHAQAVRHPRAIRPTPSPPAAIRTHASVAFTAGILQLMNDSEIEGVVAHELGHVLHRDILISSVAATLAARHHHAGPHGLLVRRRSRDDDDRGGGGLAAIAMMILAPIAAMLIQMAISRSREYDADAASAKYVGSPYPLINGLQKLET